MKQYLPIPIVGFFSFMTCSVEAESVDWRDYRSTAIVEDHKSPQKMPNIPDERAGAKDKYFTFRDLKGENDKVLAIRLLGAVGSRIAYINRRKDRWYLYDSLNDPIESIELFTQPEAWGSAFGICRVEKYTIEFDDYGAIEQVELQQRFGVEGPIFQKSDFDWDLYRGAMCDEVPSNHAASYFPASGVLAAQDLSRLLISAIHEASSKGELSFELKCQSYRGEECSSDIRNYLGELQLKDIDETSKVNCTYSSKPGEECFTVMVDKHRLGPYPKYITIRGSTYKHKIIIDSVDVRESFTVS